MKELSKACKTGSYEFVLTDTSKEIEFFFGHNECLTGRLSHFLVLALNSSTLNF